MYGHREVGKSSKELEGLVEGWGKGNSEIGTWEGRTSKLENAEKLEESVEGSWRGRVEGKVYIPK